MGGAVTCLAAAAAATATAAEEAKSEAPPLPLDKLACHPGRGKGGALKQPVVLLGCGSFNPPTFMHLRMFEAARDTLTQSGYDVLGGYLSPVHNGYGKAGLAPAEQRIHMCKLAVADSDWLMVDEWEARALEYQRTRPVLRHVNEELRASVPSDDSAKPIRVMLLCGADMLESFCVPGIWSEADMEYILQEHGVAVVMRPGSVLHNLLDDKSTVLSKHRDRIEIVRDVADNPLSSTVVRRALHEGRSVKYLVPDEVAKYLTASQLYR